MRRIIPRATNKADLLPLQLFAQILEELLFDHSDDSYKAPALNTHSRVRELRIVLKDIFNSNVSLLTATPFFEELDHSIKTDQVLDTEEAALLQEVIIEIRGALIDREKVMILISVLEGYVKNYFQRIIPALQTTLGGDFKDKLKLYRLSADFIVECEVQGFSRRYVYAETKRILKKALYSKTTVNQKEVLDSFFSCFSREQNEYEVFFAGVGASHTDDVLNRFGILSRDNFDELTLPEEAASYVTAHFREGCKFYGVPTKARDGMRAREKAEYFIELFASALVFCNHSDEFRYYSEGVVINKTSNQTYLLASPPNAMQVRTEGKAGSEERFLLIDKLIAQNRENTRAIFKLFNVFRLHRLGIRSGDSVNQLLDLWAGLEGFISRPGKDVVRISHFSNQLSAVLTLTYAEKLFAILTDEILKSHKGAVKLVDSIEGATQLEKVVKLVVADELEDKRNELGQIIGESNPLLCFRIWYLKKRFGSRKAVYESLKAHQRKITWQICRIYYARNALMHTAEMPDYLPTLVEHLHGYTDSLFWAITKLSLRAKNTTSIDGVMAVLAAQEKILLAEYEKNKDESCTLQNTLDIVFGHTNPLRPLPN